MIYIYDGTYEGFLSAVFDAYTLKKEPADIVPETGDIQIGLGGDYHRVETAEEKAGRLRAGMDKIGDGFSFQTYSAFASWMPGKEMAIYRYIVLGFRIKEKIFSKLDDDDVRKVLDMCGQTSREIYKWRGFLRFSGLDNNVYYAEMSPQNNVLKSIMPHFTRRMYHKPFLIHDTTYRQAGLWDTEKWFIRSSEGLVLPELHGDEAKYRYMWKLFYDTTAIEGRENTKRRQQVMPIRYQKQVTELRGQPLPKPAPAGLQGAERKVLAEGAGE